NRRPVAGVPGRRHRAQNPARPVRECRLAPPRREAGIRRATGDHRAREVARTGRTSSMRHVWLLLLAVIMMGGCATGAVRPARDAGPAPAPAAAPAPVKPGTGESSSVDRQKYT